MKILIIVIVICIFLIAVIDSHLFKTPRVKEYFIDGIDLSISNMVNSIFKMANTTINNTTNTSNNEHNPINYKEKQQHHTGAEDNNPHQHHHHHSKDNKPHDHQHHHQPHDRQHHHQPHDRQHHHQPRQEDKGNHQEDNGNHQEDKGNHLHPPDNNHKHCDCVNYSNKNKCNKNGCNCYWCQSLGMCLKHKQKSLCRKVVGKCSDNKLDKHNSNKRCQHLPELKCNQCARYCKWSIGKSKGIENKDGKTVETNILSGECKSKN